MPTKDDIIEFLVREFPRWLLMQWELILFHTKPEFPETFGPRRMRPPTPQVWAGER